MDLRSTAAGTPSLPMVTGAVQDMDGLLVEHMATVRMDIWSSFEHMMTLIKQMAESLQKESSRQLETDISALRMENRSLRDQLKIQTDAAEVGRLGTKDDTAESRRAGVRDTFVIPATYGCESTVPEGPRPPNLVCWVEDIKDLSDRVGNGRESLKAAMMPKRVSEATSTEITDVASTVSEKHPSFVSGAKECDSSDTEPEDLPIKSRIGGSARSSNSSADLTLAWSARASEVMALKRRAPSIKSSKSRPKAPKGSMGTKSVTKFFGVETAQKQVQKPKETIHAHQAVFADAAAMKDRVRAAISKPGYNVMDYYWDEGRCQRVARHPFFEYSTLTVIAINAIWIWIDVDNNDKELLLDAHPIFIIVENAFCVFFTFEWLVRFGAFREKRFAFRDAWFVFDSLLVIIMILETWVMTTVFLIIGGSSGGLGNTSILKLIRLVRLTRMARMAKLLRAVPELIILIKGIWVAARSVFFTLLLLVFIIYFFAIVLRQTTADTEVGELYYPSVPTAMSSLLLDAVLPDQAAIVRDNGDSNILLGCIMLLFILLSSLTVMNMLVGILCEVVSVVSAVEKEELTVNYVKSKLNDMFEDTNFDADGSKTISRDEFEKILTNEEGAKILQDIGVDVVGLVDFTDIIFEEDDLELSFGDFMDLVMQLRGSNTCTVKDMVDLRKFFVTELNAAAGTIIDFITNEPDNRLDGRWSAYNRDSVNSSLVEVVQTPEVVQRISSMKSRLPLAAARKSRARLRCTRMSRAPSRPLGQPTDLRIA